MLNRLPRMVGPLWIVVVPVALASCAGGGSQPGEARCSVAWDVPIAAPPDTIDRESVALSGSSPECTGPTSVSWHNTTTGAAGEVDVRVARWPHTECVPLFGCFEANSCLGAGYAANVPLALGDNTLELEAHQYGASACQRFTVRRVPDTTAPSVMEMALGDAPGPGSASVTFSEAVDCTTAGAAVRVSREGVPIPAVVACSASRVDLSGFTLDPLAHYTLSVSSSLVDRAGNPLAAPSETTVRVHTYNPEVVSIAPADGAVAVPVGIDVEIAFTWPIDPATATRASVALRNGSTEIATRREVQGTRVILHPLERLAGETMYTVVLTRDLAGLDGLHLAQDLTWSFTTADVTPPRIMLLVPQDGLRNFDPDHVLLAVFTEAVVLPPGGFSLVDWSGAPVAGSVLDEWSGLQLVFRPAAPLAPGATYTAALNGIMDLAGNPLPSRSWSFQVLGPGVGTWRAMSSAGAPSPRRDFAWSWTGTELLVWGGRAVPSGDLLGDGARYDPQSDAWRPISSAGAPPAHARPMFAFTGTELLVWGGEGVFVGGFTDASGGRYDPATDTWRPMSRAGAPTPRAGAAVAWTGSELVIVGGLGCIYQQSCPWGYVLGDVGQYSPSEDRWTAGSGGAPASYPASAWTGGQLLLFGSNGVGGPTSSLSWDPVALRGTSLASAGMPAAPYQASGAFSGTEFLVWGGQGASGEATARAAYAPETRTWRALSAVNEPPGGRQPAAAWTGTRLIVWGGGTRTGGLYDPATDRWETIALEGAPSARIGHAGAWTGTELLVWGGDDSGTGARYTPPP